MMTYLGKIGELTLKGSNIHTFEKLLLKNTKEYLKDTGAKVSLNAGRLYIDCEEKDSEQVEFTLRHLIGITGWAQTKTSEKTIEDIQKTVLETAKEAVQKAPARRIAESTQPSKIIAQAEKTPAQKKQTVQKTAEKPAIAKQAEQTQYWVQVTSLTSRKSADTAREVLDENKITADVFTYTDAKGQLFYRVRVGPYTTKSEAEYWQAKIARIDTFKNTSSYVASTKTAVN